MTVSRRMVIGFFSAAVVSGCANEASSGQPVSGLPHAGGRSFASLDAYLAFLKERGAMDIPFYDLQPDGRYLYNKGRGTMNDPHYFTRRQLMEKFGFSE